MSILCLQFVYSPQVAKNINYCYLKWTLIVSLCQAFYITQKQNKNDYYLNKINMTLDFLSLRVKSQYVLHDICPPLDWDLLFWNNLSS